MARRARQLPPRRSPGVASTDLGVSAIAAGRWHAGAAMFISIVAVVVSWVPTHEGAMVGKLAG